jgi:alkylation response protein AidB-like acyl-CoA dehydrogenase
MNHSNVSDWVKVIHTLGEEFASRAETHDESDTFVRDNYMALKERRVFSAAIPEELGGGGASHREISDMLRTLAQYCGSTALALSMHQHLIAAAVWKYRRGQGGEAMLKSVAEKQLVLVSTGAGATVPSPKPKAATWSAPANTLPASPWWVICWSRVRRSWTRCCTLRCR